MDEQARWYCKLCDEHGKLVLVDGGAYGLMEIHLKHVHGSVPGWHVRKSVFGLYNSQRASDIRKFCLERFEVYHG